MEWLMDIREINKGHQVGRRQTVINIIVCNSLKGGQECHVYNELGLRAIEVASGGWGSFTRGLGHTHNITINEIFVVQLTYWQ